jgi:hypothetical protein
MGAKNGCTKNSNISYLVLAALASLLWVCLQRRWDSIHTPSLILRFMAPDRPGPLGTLCDREGTHCVEGQSCEVRQWGRKGMHTVKKTNTGRGAGERAGEFEAAITLCESNAIWTSGEGEGEGEGEVVALVTSFLFLWVGTVCTGYGVGLGGTHIAPHHSTRRLAIIAAE